MRSLLACVLGLLLLPRAAWTGEPVFSVDDPEGAAARVAAPVSVEVDLEKILAPGVKVESLRLVPVDPDGKRGEPIPVQFERAASASRGVLWWLLPPGQGPRRFEFTAIGAAASPPLTVKTEKDQYVIQEGGRPVLRYHHGTVPVPPGTDAKYARGDYISPLFGPSGEVLTDDYPKDHPHHRGVSWSWPVTRWKNEVRDIWAVVGVWARPVAMKRVEAGPVMAVLEAESVWKWGDKDPIVREDVLIRAFRQSGLGRFVDVEVRLTGLVEGVAIGGRPHAGYGGFGLRAAPCQQRQITPHLDPAAASPRRSWLDYSGVFAGGQGRSGIAIFEHVANPGYPNELHQYPGCNYAMPALPGQSELPLPPGKPLVLKQRLWIHSGSPDEKLFADVWAAYANAPTVSVAVE